MMVEAFDAWGSGKTANDYHLYFNQLQATLDNPGNGSNASKKLARRHHVVDRQRDPRLDPRPANLPVEQRLIANIKSIDATRPGGGRLGPVPFGASARVGGRADAQQTWTGLGLNYDPALVVDGLHAAFPTKFFFESESSSEDVRPGRVPGSANWSTPARNYTPGQAPGLLVRQQPRVVDDERRVRPERRTATGSTSPASSSGRASTTSASRRRTHSSR